MFEELGLEGWTPVAASLVFGLGLGVLFGLLAQRSRFCLRRGLSGPVEERRSALSTWLMGLAVAVAGTAAGVHYGLVDFSGHRFMSESLPVLAIALGGLLFGIGMVLTRGCASRLTVLAGTGNLRAIVTLAVFAIVAHATIKGVLAPLRVWLGEFSVDVPGATSLAAVVGDPVLPAAVLAIALAVYAVWTYENLGELIMGALVGLLVPLSWIGTGYVLQDEFDPIALQSVAFTLPASEALFYTVAGSAIAPGFGVGFFGGVVLGSLVAALVFGDFEVVGFERKTPVGKYLVGGTLMGFGGVLAGGCTIGAGLAGVATLSFAAIIALVSIIAGGVAARVWLESGSAAPSGGRLMPAE
ncbi:MAG: YeeE/YedE family protein [Filomicrobium sp.]